MPVDVLEVTRGQDRGARFAMLGDRAVVGRSPVADLVLTDPAVGHRHARLRLAGGRLQVEDLGAVGGTLVNGRPLDGPAELAPGDVIAIGATELTVVWGSEPRAPRPAAAAPSRPPPPPAPAPPPAATARAGIGPPAVALALAALALGAVWMPFLGDERGTRSLWAVGTGGVRTQAVFAAVIAAAAAGGWMAAAVRPGGAFARGAFALTTAAAGGVITGPPLLFASIDAGELTREAGMAVMGLAGAGVCACGAAGLAALAPGPAGPRGRVAPAAGAVAAIAGAGGVLGAVAAPLPWLGNELQRLGGLDPGLGAGRALLPIALATAAAAVLTAALGRAVDRRAELPVAAVTAALAGAGASLCSAAATAFPALRPLAGLGLGLAAMAVALTAALLGGLALSLPPEEDPPR